MSVVRTVGKGIAWNTVGTIVGKLFIFLNVFIILRSLSIYEYGLSQLVLSVISSVGIFLLPGLNSVIVADLSAERGRSAYGRMKSVFLQFTGLSAGLSLAAWIVLFFGSSLAAHWAGNDAIGALIRIASFTVLVSPLRTMAQTLATVELRFVDQSLYSSIEELSKTFCLVIFLLILQLGIYGLLLSIVISQFVTVLLYIPRTWSAYRVFGSAQAVEGHAFWDILRRHRKWSIAGSYIGTLGQTLQLWIIRLLLGTEAVGLFSFADGIVSQVTSFLPFGVVLAPLLPRYVDKLADFARYVKSSIKAQVAFSFVLIIATFVGLPILLFIFPKYQPAQLIIIAEIWVIIPSAVVSIYTPAFAALKEQYAYFWSNTWKVFFLLIFTPLAIVLWGVTGTGIGTVLFMLASAIERTWRLRKVLPDFSFSLNEFFYVDAYERVLIEQVWGRWKVLQSLILKKPKSMS